MLPKKKRLSRNDFTLSINQRRSPQTSHLSMRVVSLSYKNKESHFAFIVSAKVAKFAVDRNRLRRWGYSILEKYIKDITVGKGVMFYYRKGSLLCTYSEIEKEIVEILKKSSLLHNEKSIN